MELLLLDVGSEFSQCHEKSVRNCELTVGDSNCSLDTGYILLANIIGNLTHVSRLIGISSAAIYAAGCRNTIYQ